MSQREVDILFKLLNDTASMDATAQAFDSFRNQIDDAMQGSAANSRALAATLSDELNRALAEVGANDPFTGMVESTNELNDSLSVSQQIFGDLNAQAEALNQQIENVASSAPSLAEAGGGDGGGAGGNIGSVFGIAHAATAVGRLSGAPALGEAGGALYAVQGLRQLADILPKLNDAVEPAITNIPLLGTAITTLGVEGFAPLLVTIAPIAAIIAGVAIAFGDAADQAKREKEAIDAEIKSRQEYYDLLPKTTDALKQGQAQTYDTGQALIKTSDDVLSGITKSIQNLPLGDDIKAQILKELTANPLKGPDTKSLNLAAIFDQTTLEQAPGIAEAAQKYSDLQKQIAANIQSQQNYSDALSGTDRAATDAAEAARKQAEEQVKTTALYAADDQLTTDAIKKKIEALSGDAESQRSAANLIQQSSNNLDQNSEEWLKNQQAIQAHNDAAAQDEAEVNHLTETSLGLAQAHDAEKLAAEEAKKAQQELNKEINQYQSDLQKAATEQDAYNQQVLDAHTKSDDQLHALIQQTAEQRQKIEVDEGRKEQDIVTQTESAIQDIRTKEGNKEAQIVQDYNNQLQDDQTKYHNDLQKLVIDEQRVEQQDAVDHQQKLAQIRKDAQNNEFDDILNRDFLKLYEDQQKQQQQTTAEDQHFQEEDTKLRNHLTQQEQDLETHLQQEEAQQKIAEQRKLAAAQLTMQQEIQQQNVNEERKEQALEVSEERQLQDLETAYNQKQVLIEQSLNNELNLYEQNFQARQRLLIEEETQLLNQISAAGATAITNPNNPNSPIPSENYASGVGGYATGGDFSAGIPFQMAEKGAEALNIGGGRYLIPGRALVLPMEGGSVTPNGDLNGGGKQINVTVTIPISGVTDPVAVAQMVDSKLTATLQKAFLNG